MAKNVLAASDIKNKDGTYTQEDFNPSKIPYSQITLENAAEAFPFLGYTGQTPNYIEILPGDNASIIADNVYYNLIGKDPKEWGTLAPYHTYKSKEEHDAAIAEEQCKIEEEQKRQQEGRADLEAGEHIGGNISEEEFESIWTFD